MKLKQTQKLTLFLLFLLLVGGGLLYWQTAYGVTRTWDGGGTDGTCGGGAGDGNKWSCAANWSADTAPTASDVATFDATSTKDATIAANVSVAGINIALGYTGTITQTSTFTITVGSSAWVQAAGTFVGGSGNISTSTSFTFSSGTFTSTSGTLAIGSCISAVMTVSSGTTFNHNNGTVTLNCFNTSGAATYTIDVATTLTLYNIVLNTADSSDNYVVASGDTLIAANDFTHAGGILGGPGVWEVQNNVIIGAGSFGGTGTL
ncbi:MAG: hypothetical protein Q8O53_00935, partial [Candidatus Moranbacteria bacterium]|nr:hypothetical protein [Candidatus Moranbacteria bacterium]